MGSKPKSAIVAFINTELRLVDDANIEVVTYNYYWNVIILSFSRLINAVNVVGTFPVNC